MLDSRLKGLGYEPHRRHCFVSLSKNINPSLVLDQPRKTCPFINERLLIGRKESIQTALESLQFCAGWTEPLLLDNVISAKISCVDSFRIIQLNTGLDKQKFSE